MCHGKLYLLDSFLPSLGLSLESQSSNYCEPLFKFLGILTLVDANTVWLRGGGGVKIHKFHF